MQKKRSWCTPAWLPTWTTTGLLGLLAACGTRADLTLPVAGAGAGVDRAASVLALVPQPTSLQTADGMDPMTLPRRVVILADRLDNEVNHLAAWLGKFGVAVQSGPGNTEPGSGSISLRIDAAMNQKMGKEAYRLVVAEDRIAITGGSSTGVFWGIQTLKQIAMRGDGTSAPQLPLVQIDDAPRFPWRGQHLDVSRHFFSAAFVKRYIELMSRYKLNVFHWHLTDDHGWRVPIDKYPKLTKEGAWSEDRRHEPFGLPDAYREPLPADSKPYGGAYTKEEIRDVVDFAALHHVTIVPDVDLPGHAQAALTAYPELGCEDKAYKVAHGAVSPFSDPLCACKPAAFQFVRDVYTEIAALFPGPWIHIGGDEVNTTPWNSPVCKAFMKQNGMKTLEELHAAFNNTALNVVRELGRLPIAFEEVQATNPPQWVVIQSWRDNKPAAAAARAGRDAIVLTQDSLYFGTGVTATPEDLGPGFTPIRIPYEVEIIPGDLEPQFAKHILGLQGSLWSEQVADEKKAERAILPRMLAVAENGWLSPEKKDLADFSRRLLPHLADLGRSGYTVFVPGPVGVPERKVFETSYTVTVEAPVKGSVVRYTIDGTTPGPASPELTAPLTVDKSTDLRTRAFYPGDVASEVVKADLVRATPVAAVQVTAAAPGLCTEYREGIARYHRFVSRMPVLDTSVETEIALPKKHAENLFGLTFTGFVAAPSAGIYRFCTTTNDGSALRVAGQQVVDNDGTHRPVERCGEIALAAGHHPLELVYFEDSGGEHLQASWAPPGAELAPLGGAALWHERANCKLVRKRKRQ